MCKPFKLLDPSLTTELLDNGTLAGGAVVMMTYIPDHSKEVFCI